MVTTSAALDNLVKEQVMRVRRRLGTPPGRPGFEEAWERVYAPLGREQEALGYSPEQLVVLGSLARNIQVIGGWQSGKSFISADFLTAHMYLRPDSHFWIVGKTYELCHPEFLYAYNNLQALGAKVVKESMPAMGKWSLRLKDGQLLETKSADDPASIQAVALDGCLIVEAALIPLVLIRERLTGRLTTKRGWLLMNGTYESSLGWYPEYYRLGQHENAEGWQSFRLPSWTNLHAFPGGRDDPEIKHQERVLPANLFNEKYGAMPAPPVGIVFPEFTESYHIRPLTFDESQPVYLWVDPGYAGAYAVEVVQIKGDAVYIIDEIYERGLITDDIISIAQTRPWWKGVFGGVIDISGRQHQGEKSAVEMWATASVRLKRSGERVASKDVHLGSQAVGIVDGINRTRTFLKIDPVSHEPHLFIAPKCRGLISEGGLGPSPFEGGGVYRYKLDSQGNAISEIPEDKNNHAWKAVAYGLIDRFGVVARARQRDFSMVRSRGAV